MENQTRIQSPTKKKVDTSNPDEALDGGWGWVIVFAAFMVYFLSFGGFRCQSVLFVPLINEFEADFSYTGWFSAMFGTGMAVAGPISAVLIAKLGHRLTVMIGGLLTSFATVVSAWSPSLLMLNVIGGGIAGFGIGTAFVASPVIIGFYFKKRRALATNIASMGSSVGTFILCPLNALLIDAFGIRGYFVILGGIFLQLVVVGALMRPLSLSDVLQKVKKSKNYSQDLEHDRVAEAMTDVGLLKTGSEKDSHQNRNKAKVKQETPSWKCLFLSPPFIMYCFSQVVFLAGYIVHQLYIVPFAVKQLEIPSLKAPLVMSIAACAELVSRIIFGILGDVERINRLLMYACVLTALSLCALSIPFATSFETLAGLTAVSGLFQGGYSGISIVVLADIVGLQMYGTALGISTLMNGVSTLLAPPLVGLAVDYTDDIRVALFISAGMLFFGAFLTFMIQVTVYYQTQPSKKTTSSVSI